MAERYDEQYRDRGYRRDDRGFMERAGDEVRSWFGDDEAERRRHYDEQQERGDRSRERQYGQSGDYSGRYDRSHDRSSSYPTGEQDWNRSRGQGAYGRDAGARNAGPSYGAGQGSGYGSGYSSGSSSGSYGGGSGSYNQGGYNQGSGWGSQYGTSYGPSHNPGYGQGSSQQYGGGSGVRDDDRSDWRQGFGGYRSESRGGFAGRGPKGYQRSDQRIHEDVCDRLSESPDIDASEIEITVNNGEVTLAGSVSDRGEKRRAEDLVEQISGVREVCNNLRVSRGQDATISGTGSERGSGTPSVTGAADRSGSGAGASGSSGGGMVANPGITGGGPSGATDVSGTSGAGTPGSTLGLTGSPDKASTAGGRR